MSMIFQDTLILIAIFINIILVFSLLKYTKKSRSRTYFLLFTSTILAWSVSELTFRIILGGNIEILTKILYIIAALTPSAFLYFVLIYPEDREVNPKVKAVIIAELLLMIFLIVGSKIIIIASIPDINENHVVVFGNLYFLYLFHIMGVFALALLVLAKKYFSFQDKEQKKRVVDVLIGSAITAIFAIITNLLAPYFGINDLDWLGPIFSISIPFFASKGMLSEKIFGARILFQRKVMLRTVIAALVLAYLGAIYLGYSFLNLIRNSHFQVDHKTIFHLFAFIVSFVCIIIFLTAILISKTEKDTPRKIFIFILFMLAGWIASIVGSELMTDPMQSLFWARLPYFFIIWLPPALIFLFHHIVHNKLPGTSAKVTLTIIALLVLAISQTKLYIQGIQVLPNGSQEVITGMLYGYDAAYYIVGIIVAGLITIKNWSRLDNTQKSTLKIIGPTFFLAIFPPAITQDILPAFGFSYFYAPFGTLLGIFLIITGTSIAILKFKFLHLRLFFKRRFATTTIIASLVVLYTSLLLLIGSAINNFYVYNNNKHLLVELLTKNAMHIFTFIFLVVFSTFIAAKKPENRQQKIFYSVLIMIGLWLALLTAAEFATGSNTALLWWNRINYIPVLWFPMAMSYLFHNIIYKKNPRKTAFWLWLVATLLAHYVFLSNLFIVSVVRTSPLGFLVTPGPLQILEAPFFMSPFIIYVVLAIKNWDRIDAHNKKQLKIILPGFTLATIPPVIADQLVINMGYSHSLDQYTNFLAVLGFVITTTVAIFDHKFLDIKLKITARLVRRLFATVLVLFVLPLVIWFLFVKQYFPQNTNGRIITILFIIFALFPLFNRLLENFINRMVFKNVKTPAEIINHIVEKISTTTKANLIPSVLLRELTIQLNLHGAAYFAKTNSHFELQKEMNYPEAANLSRLASTKETTAIFKKENSYTLEALTKLPSANLFVKKLEEANAEVVIPFKIENELVGLLVLKEKKHNEAFAKDELHILDTLSFHFAATIHNAILYAKVKSFASSLEKKVEQATRALKAKNEELAKIQEEKSKFFADIAHEFKTPITVLRGSIDVASSYLPAEQGAGLQKEIQRMSVLTTELLELSQAESGTLILNIQQIDLVEILEEAVEEASKLIKEKNIVVCLNSPDNLFIEGDRNRLHQIILNLITNAIKYNKEKGRINIQLNHNDGNVTIKISDTGIGIAQKDLSRVFERFYRVDKTYSKKLESTGLGLAIVKLMTELHGGTVSVESKLGEGTTFVVTLPKAQPKKPKK